MSPLVHFGAVVADAPSALSTPRCAAGQAQLRLVNAQCIALRGFSFVGGGRRLHQARIRRITVPDLRYECVCQSFASPGRSHVLSHACTAFRSPQTPRHATPPPASAPLPRGAHAQPLVALRARRPGGAAQQFFSDFQTAELHLKPEPKASCRAGPWGRRSAGAHEGTGEQTGGARGGWRRAREGGGGAWPRLPDPVAAPQAALLAGWRHRAVLALRTAHVAVLGHQLELVPDRGRGDVLCHGRARRGEPPPSGLAATVRPGFEPQAPAYAVAVEREAARLEVVRRQREVAWVGGKIEGRHGSSPCGRRAGTTGGRRLQARRADPG